MSPARSLAICCAAVAALSLGIAGCGSGGGPSTGGTTTQLEGGTGAEDAEANTVSIDMKDYRFSISGELTAGTANLAVTNSGAELHMAGFLKLADGKTVADLQSAFQSQDQSAFDSVIEEELGNPGTILSPGQTQQTTTDALDAGTYAVICYLPTAGEAEPTPHFAKGMLSALEVAEGSADLTRPEPDAEYTVDKGKTDGPKQVEAGEATFKATAGPDGPHEFFVMRKSAPDTTFDDVDRFFTGLFEDDAAPPPGYAEKAPAVFVASSFDLDAGGSVFLTADLEPGSYLVGCALAPDDEAGGTAKPHTGEVLEVTVA